MNRPSERVKEQSVKQLTVIAELVRGVAVTRAAEIVGVSRRQVTRWMADAVFRRELERQKCESYEIALLQAQQALVEQMGRDKPDGVRYRAADALLQYDVKIKRRRRGKSTGSSSLDKIRQIAIDMTRAQAELDALDAQQADGASADNGVGSRGDEPEQLSESRHIERLSPEQLNVMVELAKGTFVVDAAKITGVGRRTITRWASEDEAFREELDFQKDAVFGTAVQKALRTLEELMADDKPKVVSFKAAESFLRYDAGLRFSQRNKAVDSRNLEKLSQMATDMQREVDERRALHIGRIDAVDTTEVSADDQVDQADGADEVEDAA